MILPYAARPNLTVTRYLIATFSTILRNLLLARTAAQHVAVFSQVPKYELVPRGMTALLDAVGRAINATGQRLAKMDEQDRPGLVVFVVMPDGQENSSKEFSKTDIKAMIQRQQDTYNWHFTFLGANQDAFAEAGGMGIAAAGVANFAVDKMPVAYAVTGGKLSRMRRQSRQGETVRNELTDEERKRMS